MSDLRNRGAVSLSAAGVAREDLEEQVVSLADAGAFTRMPVCEGQISSSRQVSMKIEHR
jgi:hypothetical protein